MEEWIARKLSEQYKLIYFKDLGDERGDLVVIEGEGMDIPFDIKRVFYMYGSDSTVVMRTACQPGNGVSAGKCRRKQQGTCG